MSESGTTQSHLEAGIPLKDVASCANENHTDDGIRLYIEPSSATGSDSCLVIVTPLQEENFERPEAFISDDCPVFWNAFVNVFPDAAAVSRRLLCARQVERAVFAHLKKEFPSDHAATQNLTEYLKLLFIESNKPRWQKALTYFLGLLADLQLDKGNQRISKVVTEFESCSRTKYLAPVSKYRAPYSLTFAIMNTNMFDERYNKTIKYDYLYKSANSRIEYVVRELIDSRFREDKRSPNTFLQQLHLEVKAYFVAPRAAFAPPIAAIGGEDLVYVP
ncbi:hypothetical protein Y032_0012g1732 [Ancylostoma ceylanicum]|nr:hypothetical protein Y032_0012g1732 [Ancylostoma ceylanicum]